MCSNLMLIIDNCSFGFGSRPDIITKNSYDQNSKLIYRNRQIIYNDRKKKEKEKSKLWN